ncbi:LytTR family DNA-binding domain-containing protein [uncultured Winogradskyella sp.]|uniref:LytR/AlgR family response regulator transcription factor n=1 Tax=uncultured Winogradskyella sp. TaxID=395353 RepID=UPI00261EBDD8|nr:response regulator transcription factor [uncultured Winogradskyella sp.]
MKSLNIFIVEDEPLIVSTIEVALRKQGFCAIGDAEDFTTALRDIELLKPDLILIDIQLNGEKDGVDLATELDKKNLPYMFLSSQTDPNTIERVKYVNPLGYIVKPFTETSLRTNIELAWHKYSESKQHFIVIKHEGRLHRINQNSISYLKAFDNYCYIITNTKTYLVPHTLKHISEQLKGDNFIKAHRSYVVNLNHILSVDKNTITLKNDSIPVSASQKSLVVSKLKTYK